MSGQIQGSDVDLSAVNGAVAGDAGVSRGAELLAFVEAVMGRDVQGREAAAQRAEGERRQAPAEEALEGARAALRAVLSPEAFVDACAVIGAFNVVDRIADSTGIPLDDGLVGISGDVRTELDLARFASSANTPGESA